MQLYRTPEKVKKCSLRALLRSWRYGTRLWTEMHAFWTLPQKNKDFYNASPLVLQEALLINSKRLVHKNYYA